MIDFESAKSEATRTDYDTAEEGKAEELVVDLAESVVVLTEESNPVEVMEEPKEDSSAIAILREYNMIESDIPINSEYWKVK